MVSTYEKKVRSVSKSFDLPKIIRLRNFIRKINLVSYSRKKVFERDQYVCQYCKIKVSQKTATIDHVIPKSKGGKNTWTNTVTSCDACNSKKGSKTLKEANMKLISTPIRPSILGTIKGELKDCFEEIMQQEY